MIQLNFTITQPSKYTTKTQLKTALVNCFCNTELRTATVTKIKGLSIQMQLNMFVLFTLLKLTLDECKTLTKISMRNLSQQFPQTSAHFRHDKIRNKKTSKKHLASILEEASCIKPGKASCSYHHIGLSEQSKSLTAFTTHSGKFQWNVLPFGIGIGVQTFSFVINKAIGHCSDFAAKYLDDIIIFSRTVEDHMEHLEKVFNALQAADSKIKVSKCKFFKKHVSYLGFLIGETGIHCDRSKVEAINKIPTPTSIEEVHQFNGMCSYYHKFISHYSDICKCFNDMTRKGATFNWTKECEAAFKLLKEKLMENPVLISPQVDKDYVTHCDASKYSYSGILQQTRPGTEELAPVAYYSGNFDKTQVKWNITEKEAYTIYKSIKKFTFYITGAKTMVFSNHKPLKNFFEGGMNITKLDRWSLELQEFDISLEFI